MTMTQTTYVVRDAGGEYLAVDGDRTPCGDSAAEYETYAEAEAALDRGSDRVYARRDGKWDWAVTAQVAEEEIVDEDDLICGNQVQHDNSGVGHNWRNISATDIPANIREEIEGEMIDGGKDECDSFRASNGLYYRW